MARGGSEADAAWDPGEELRIKMERGGRARVEEPHHKH